MDVLAIMFDADQVHFPSDSLGSISVPGSLRVFEGNNYVTTRLR